MMKNEDQTSTYKTIGQITKELGLIDKKSGSPQTHTLRYWETQFPQIKPKIRAGKRRYYSKKDFETIKYVKYLLKEKGLTINGVKKVLDSAKNQHIDHNASLGIYNPKTEYAKNIKEKIKNISKIIK